MAFQALTITYGLYYRVSQGKITKKFFYSKNCERGDGCSGQCVNDHAIMSTVMRQYYRAGCRIHYRDTHKLWENIIALITDNITALIPEVISTFIPGIISAIISGAVAACITVFITVINTALMTTLDRRACKSKTWEVVFHVFRPSWAQGLSTTEGQRVRQGQG